MASTTWKSPENFCDLCCYELLGEEADTWPWCFHCGNGSPTFQIMEQALREIGAMKGMCTYGTPEMYDASKEAQDAFRTGSAHAFDEMAARALKALTDIQKGL